MEDSGSAARKLLLVDDEASVRAMLQAVLETENYKVTTAASAAEAKVKLQGQGFDAVITDMRMETALAGFDVVRAARRSHPGIVVIIISAFALREHDWRGEGVDAALTKPVPIAELLGTIDELLRPRRQVAR